MKIDFKWINYLTANPNKNHTHKKNFWNNSLNLRNNCTISCHKFTVSGKQLKIINKYWTIDPSRERASKRVNEWILQSYGVSLWTSSDCTAIEFKVLQKFDKQTNPKEKKNWFRVKHFVIVSQTECLN